MTELDGRVLSTRRSRLGYKVRLRERADGTRYQTVELQCDELMSMLTESQSLTLRADIQPNGRKSRIEYRLLRANLTPRLLAGEKLLAISVETGIPEYTLQRWRTAVRRSAQPKE